jgi:hypothetical protein
VTGPIGSSIRFSSVSTTRPSRWPLNQTSSTWFPSDYLRTADPFRVVTWLGPRHVWHPNIAADAPAICVGRLVPGTSLVDLIYQVFEIITWNKVTMREDDALNRAACQWARSHRERLRIDRRPLKRRALDLRIEDAGERSANDGQM